MGLKFLYSVETEFERVNNTLAKKDFFRKYGYAIYLPGNFTLDSTDLEGLRSQIKKELKSEVVNRIKEEIVAAWQSNNELINKFFNAIRYKKPDHITIQLTKYGVGGSYSLPSKIILNVNYRISPLKNVIHEIIHLLIEEPIIKKYQLDHSHKEGIVDWLMINEKNLKSMFPDYKYQKNISVAPSQVFIKKIGWDNLIQK